MTETKFDASKYITKLKGKDYLEVKWRLLWLRTEQPNASLNTDMVEHGQDFALFKAVVAIPNGGSATGWGSETKGDFTDFIEKAETKAIGRALAALGYGTQFCDDHADVIADSPVQRPTPIRPQQTPAPSVQPVQRTPPALWPEVEQFPDVGAFLTWCNKHFHLTASAVWRECNIKGPQEVTELIDLQRYAVNIRAVYGSKAEEV